MATSSAAKRSRFSMAKGAARTAVDSVAQPAAVFDFGSRRATFNAFHSVDNDFFNDVNGLDFAHNAFFDSGLEPKMVAALQAK